MRLRGGRYALDNDPYEEWSIPRTTLNTIVQEHVEKGHVRLVSTGHKEKEIVLTESGRVFAGEMLTPIFEAEETAPFIRTQLVEQMEALAGQIKAEFGKIRKRD